MKRLLQLSLAVLAATIPTQLLAAQATAGRDARQQDKARPATRPSTVPSVREARRSSVDGIEFPPAGERKFHAMLPVVRDKLGALPEEMGSRVFNTKTSAALLAKHIPGPLNCEWYVVGFAGADIAGFDLTDGRVTRIVIVRAKPSPAVADAAAKDIAKLGDGKVASTKSVPAKDKSSGAEIPLTVTIGSERMQFELDHVEWYLLNHATATEIAKGMRAKVPVKGMSIAEATCAFGQPEQKDEGSNGEVVCQWREWEPMPGQARIMSPAQVYQEMQASALSNAKPPMRNTRTVEIRFRGGIAVDVSDTHFNK